LSRASFRDPSRAARVDEIWNQSSLIDVLLNASGIVSLVVATTSPRPRRSKVIAASRLNQALQRVIFNSVRSLPPAWSSAVGHVDVIAKVASVVADRQSHPIRRRRRLCRDFPLKEAAVRMILLVALGSAVAVSGRAQAPDATSSIVRVEARTMSRQQGGAGLSMGGVTFYLSDGTQLSAREAITSGWTGTGVRSFEMRNGTVDPGAAHREFVLTGDVRLKLSDRSTFLR
jgi:hypothetical protein